MVETSSEQVRPLAPAYDRHTSSDEESSAVTGIRRRRCLKCCGCAAAVILIQAVVVVILIFTVFKVKEPVIRMNKVTVLNLDLVNGTTTTPRPGSNMTLNADVSVKNPNHASFRYMNTTTTLYYRGAVIGEARGPPGSARARRTMRMNVTVEVITDRVLSNPDLGTDINTGLLTMSTYTVVGGRVKMLMIKKHLTVRMNCSMTINITSQAIQEQKCKRKVKL